eukprot:c41738_g1_i1 orf=22-219(-)
MLQRFRLESHSKENMSESTSTEKQNKENFADACIVISLKDVFSHPHFAHISLEALPSVNIKNFIL